MAYPRPAHRSNPRVISIHPVEIPCWRLEPGMQHLCNRSWCTVRAACFQGDHFEVSQEADGSDHSYGPHRTIIAFGISIIKQLFCIDEERIGRHSWRESS